MARQTQRTLAHRMTIRKAPCSTQSPSVFSVNGAQYLKSVRKGVDTQFRGRSETRAPRPVMCGGGWTFEWDPDPYRCADKPTIVPAFWGIVCRGRSKGGGGAVLRDRSAELPGVVRAFSSFLRLDTVATFAPVLLREDEPVVVLSQAAKKAGELVTNPSLPSFLRQFQFTFRCPTRLLRETTRHAPIPFRR